MHMVFLLRVSSKCNHISLFHVILHFVGAASLDLLVVRACVSLGPLRPQCRPSKHWPRLTVNAYMLEVVYSLKRLSLRTTLMTD